MAEVLRKCHDAAPSGHCGTSRTCALVKLEYVVHHLNECVRKYLRTCDLCQKFKADHHLPGGYIDNLEIPVQRWQSISMDWLSLLTAHSQGEAYNLTVMDRATEMVHLLPTRDAATAKQTAYMFFEKIVSYNGLPRSIV